MIGKIFGIRALTVSFAAVLVLAAICPHTVVASPTVAISPVDDSVAAPAVSPATIVAFVTNNVSDYWTVARKGAEKAVQEDPSITLKFDMPADGSAATQKADVEALLASGVKAIAISPVYPKSESAWLDEIAAKVPLVTQDADAPDSNRLAFIGSDNYAAGLQAGGLIKRALPNGGKIEIFVGMTSPPNARDRAAGIRDALKGSNVKILDTMLDDADHARAKANAAQTLVDHPDIAGLVGLWSYNGPAIVSALYDAHKIGKVKVVCFDEDRITLTAVKSGAIYGTVVQQPYLFGYQAVKLLKALALGDASGVPDNKMIYIPTLSITKNNVDAYTANLNALIGN